MSDLKGNGLRSKYVIDTRDGLQTDAYGDNIPSLFQGMRDELPLMIYFHGALTDRDRGLANADNMCECFASQADSLYYVYDSGPLRETLKAAAELLARNLISRILGHIKDMLVSAVAPGLGMAEVDPEEELRQRIEGDAIVREELKAFVSNDSAAFAFDALMSGAPLDEDARIKATVDASLAAAFTAPDAPRNELGFGVTLNWVALAAQAAKKAIEIYWAVRKRLDAGRDHGMPQTLIEEIVRALLLVGQTWTVIKAEVETAFSTRRGAAGTKLVQALAAYRKDHPDRRVVLVGHSTGALYVANFILAAKRAGVTGKFDVRLLAGAATMGLYRRLFTEASDLVGSIRTYGMGDAEFESKEHLLDLPFLQGTPLRNFYIGSLLYFVSGGLEDYADIPLVGMERFFELPENLFEGRELAEVQAVRAGISDRVWSSKTSALCKAESHGGFAGDPATRKSLLT